MMERLRILEDARQLKQLAQAFLYPERPVVSDGCASGRNYFDRPSGFVDEDFEEERARILEDARALKQSAMDYLHPELSVVTTDATASGRNYFDRASAPEQETMEEVEEREQILKDLKALKEAAVQYLHPELPVVTTGAPAVATTLTAPLLLNRSRWRRLKNANRSCRKPWLSRSLRSTTPTRSFRLSPMLLPLAATTLIVPLLLSKSRWRRSKNANRSWKTSRHSRSRRPVPSSRASGRYDGFYCHWSQLL